MKNPVSKLWIVFFFGLMMGATSSAFAEEKGQVFKVSKATRAIKIDGKLDAEWKRTEVGRIEHFYRNESPEDRQKATFRMLWDEENLYAFFECEDRFITAKETQRDGQPYLDDCAELFLIPVPAPLDMHFGFEINLYKASNDFIFLTNFHEGSMVALKSYDPEFEVEVSINGSLNDHSDADKGWTLELAIPLKLFNGVEKFSPVAPGNRWAFQAIRQDRNDAAGDRRAFSTLFPLADKTSGVHLPHDFGFLEFVE